MSISHKGQRMLMVDVGTVIMSAFLGAVIGGLMVYLGYKENCRHRIDAVTNFWTEDMRQILTRVEKIERSIGKKDV